MTTAELFSNGSAVAYILDGKGGCRKPTPEQIDAWKPGDGVLWTHLNYCDELSKVWLTEKVQLDDLVVDALLAEETRPRAALFDEGLLTMLRGVNLNPGADPEDMVSIRVWITEDRIITTRKRDLISINDILERFEKNRGPKTPSDFLVMLAKRLIHRIGDITDQFDDRVAELEEAVLEERGGEVKNDLSNLRRQAIILRRYLAPEREALSDIINSKEELLDEDQESSLRETNDRLLRYIEEIDVIRERAAVTQEELHSRLSEKINERMYVLSVIAAIFLPLGFLTGLLGINVAGIPGADYPHAFFVFVGGLTVLVLSQIILFRWKRWM